MNAKEFLAINNEALMLSEKLEKYCQNKQFRRSKRKVPSYRRHLLYFKYRYERTR